jgi:hypothetical protein
MLGLVLRSITKFYQKSPEDTTKQSRTVDDEENAPQN